MNARPDAILFDLFGTLVFFDDDRLPRMEVGGRSVVMTVRSMPELLRRACPHASMPLFLTTLQEVGAELAEVKRRAGIEILTHVRFERALLRHGVPEQDAADIALRMAREHMDSLFAAVLCPADRVPLLRQLGRHHRLALLSNFDDGATARRILDTHGLTPMLETAVISADVGLRKPSREIFARTCARMSLAPQQCLYVGDTWREDIEGATGAGLAAVWVTSEARADPPALGRIGDANELPRWLELRGW
ncbi:MAG TPA: HAD family hydrolase [Candidatus Limnocylindrales bacterium]|nr:HAD family hydrolase [Candidatus Limnocylindrales bacterium]